MTEPALPALRPTSDFFAELLKISEMKIEAARDNDSLQDVRKCTYDSSRKSIEMSIKQHPMREALFQVLLDQKDRKRLSTRMMNFTDDEDTEKNTRLDNMLVAEGIVGPPINTSAAPDAAGSEQHEYRQKLKEVRQKYEERMQNSAESCRVFTQEVQRVIDKQREFRPITKGDSDQIVNSIVRKFDKLPVFFKQSACEAVVHLKKRFFDARRKRRNFAKSSTDILNEYFHANLDHPYPSEEVKQALAVQCNISVAQVSNWFGNKRIRFKKTLAKDKEVKRDTVRKHTATAAMTPYGLMPRMMNPYQMMMPGQQFPMAMPPFNFPMYDPAMMAQYQQSMQNAMPKQ